MMTLREAAAISVYELLTSAQQDALVGLTTPPWPEAGESIQETCYAIADAVHLVMRPRLKAVNKMIYMAYGEYYEVDSKRCLQHAGSIIEDML